MTYVTGFLSPVPEGNKQAYIDSAEVAWALFAEYGAVAHWECWEEDVPDGEVTSFPMAVKREAGEKVVLSWLVWPDKAAADACFASMETDERWRDMDMPFDGKRMMWGGFDPIFMKTA